VLESNAKRADERMDLEDLRRATKVVARTLLDLLALSAWGFMNPSGSVCLAPDCGLGYPLKLTPI
jgi:hypothetical protein